MRRGLHILMSVLLLVASTGVPARAQGLTGQTIQAIEFVGLETLAEETLSFYLGIKVGEPYSAQDLNEKIQKLWSTKLIDDIEIETEPVEGGLKLLVTVKERPTLRSIEYQGLKRVNRTDITDRIARDRIQVREGDPLNLGELRRLKAAIEEIYREKGFRIAEAQFTIEAVSKSERRVTFTIDEGDKVRVADIDFEGNTVFRDGGLKRSMKDTKESGFLTRIFKKDVFNAAAFEEDLNKVRDKYRRAGYKNIVLGDPKIEIRAVNPSAASERQKRRLFITVPIEEGDRWKLGGISIEGNEIFSDEFLLRLIERPSGGWLRSKVIEEGIETINEVYSNSGHLFARVEPELIEREDQIADLVVHVNEGDQFRVGRIEFEGNTKTRDKVIRREMGIQEGLLLNTGALRNSLLRIRQLEFFRIDEEDPVAFDINEEDQTVDLRIKGEEGDRTELLFGGGFSEIDGFFGQFQFRTRNFLGRGETLGVSIQSGARQDVYDLSYYVPWFMDRPQSIGVQVFQRRLDYSLFGGGRNFQDTRGGTLTYGRNLGLFRSVSISYSFFDSEETLRSIDPAGEPVEFDTSRSVSTVRLAFAKDRRDSRLQPTVGARHAFSLDYSGGVLGGTTNFWRPRASYTIYKPITKTGTRTVFAFNVEVAAIEAFNDVPLFYSDRLFLGGETSVRGFRFRDITVRDEDGNRLFDPIFVTAPQGGERSLQLNLEYIFLLGGPFRLIVFTDGGKVFNADQEVNLDNFRYTAGVELQVNVPVLGAPLRFIYAQNLDPFPDDRFETFQFSVGPGF